MKYYLDLSSPTTWKAFNGYGGTVSGFTRNQGTEAKKLKEGSIFLCYLVKVSRWVGALKITSEMYEDNTPIFANKDDKFVCRFNVEILVSLDVEYGIPIREDFIWNNLEWTKNKEKNQIGWAGYLQRSLRVFPDKDGNFLLDKLIEQKEKKQKYPLSPEDQKKIDKFTTIIYPDGPKDIEIPDDYEEPEPYKEISGTREETLKIQLALASIGAKLGYDIWIDKGDRTEMGTMIPNTVNDKLLETLPLSLDKACQQTLENIDVLWIKGRGVVRAFEVESTTAIYSGLLRMSDLASLIPNVTIKFHIVAHQEKKDKVITQIERPTFTVVGMSKNCTFLSFDSVNKILNLDNLAHLRHTIIDSYAEEKDY